MNHIYNITFVCGVHDAPFVLDFLREELLHHICIDGAFSPRLARVRSSENDAVSFALELHLPDLGTLKNWREKTLLPVLENVSRKWGERLVNFHTVLEPINLSL